MSSTSVISSTHQIVTSEDALLNCAIELSRLYAKEIPLSKRKESGQIFTPKKTAMYMANFFDLSKSDLSLLDPGSGTGNLLSAVCQRIINEAKHPMNVRIDAFENDSHVIPYLEQVLDICTNELEKRGHSLQYTIIKEDFIQSSQKYLNGSLFSSQDDYHYYDAVISNPPYFKMSKNSIQAIVLKDFVAGQPNIFSFFMLLSARMLKRGGEFVFIIPRSFCSGLYYEKIRRWFVYNTRIKWIHSFESRRNAFGDDDILQENIILYAIKTDDKTSSLSNACSPSKISSSYDNTFDIYTEIEVPYQDLIYRRDKGSFIRIPTSKTELDVIKTVDLWSHTLEDFGLRMSTGPVVDFRTKENLRSKCSQDGCVPLLWMQNVRGETIAWPVDGLNKPQAIEVNSSTKNILLPVKNYVLIKRFTSKEQNRRIYATPFLKTDFNTYNYIGLENHLNYIHRFRSEMTVDEVYGLTVLLNTKIVDTFFRVLNGNTQVNASEINLLPLPDIDIIRKIGKSYLDNKEQDSLELDRFVSEFIDIDSMLINRLTELGSA